MSRYLFVVVTLLIATPWLYSSVQAQEITTEVTGDVSSFTLSISGMGKAEGEVRIAMFDSKELYKKEPVFAVVLPTDSLSVDWNVPGLPYGEYAVAVYHDKNENGKLDTNFLGIPKERYGFSNNARGRFGPASWEDAKFLVDRKELAHHIRIK